MAAIVAAAREPTIGEIRLLWWRDALIKLDDANAPVPAEPLLNIAATRLVATGLQGAAIAGIEEGWGALLEAEEPGETEIAAHGEKRGALLFALSARLLGTVPDDVGHAGEGWALADLGHRMRSATARQFARDRATAALKQVNIARWPSALRPLGLLAILARGDAAMPADQLRRQGAPKRLFRALAYRLIGR